jgi:hypothetical protein
LTAIREERHPEDCEAGHDSKARQAVSRSCLARGDLVRYAFLEIRRGCSRFQIGIPSGCSTLSIYFGS